MMSQSFELTDKHCEILAPLTCKVRVLTLEQIARTYFSSNKPNDKAARNLITELEIAGFLKNYSAMVHPEIKLKAPLCRYSPGDPTPDFGPIASMTRGRWKQAPVSTEIVYATQYAKEVFGGYLGGKKPRPSETRHDIHVAQIFLQLAKQDPTFSNAWISEEQLLEEREAKQGRVPDVVLRLENPVIIEFGGAYPRAKLEAFHDEQKTQTYEIW